MTSEDLKWETTSFTLPDAPACLHWVKFFVGRGSVLAVSFSKRRDTGEYDFNVVQERP